MSPALLALGSVAVVSLISLIGLATLGLNPERVRRAAIALVSFAVGTLLGDAFIHLIPEAFAGHGADALGPSLLMLGGMLLFFVVEKLLRHRHHALQDPAHASHHGDRPELAAINLVGDGIHNFIDGALIAASYLVSPALGIATTTAVLFHELPQELGDFGVLIHSGLPVKKAVLLNLASASVALVGAALTLAVGARLGQAVSEVLVPMTAGGFVYIAAADLIPELQEDRSWRALLIQAPLITLGALTMAALTLLE